MPEPGNPRPWWRDFLPGQNEAEVRRGIEEHRAAEARLREQRLQAAAARRTEEIRRVQGELLRGRPEPFPGQPSAEVEHNTHHNIQRTVDTYWSAQQPASPTGRLNAQFEEMYRRAQQDRASIQAQQDQWGHVASNAGAFVGQLQREVEELRQVMNQRFNQQLFQDGQQYVRAVAPVAEEDNVPETLKKRSREMKLMYPFAIDHCGRSYRMSYHTQKRRWRLQEWDSKRCEKIHEEFIRGQALAHATRQRWMEARSAELVPTT
jgi:hypothetical protein